MNTLKTLLVVILLALAAVNVSYAEDTAKKAEGDKSSEQAKDAEKTDPFTKEKITKDDKKKKKPGFFEKLHDKYKDKSMTESFYESLDQLDKPGK